MKVVDRNLNGGTPVESARAQETQRANQATGSGGAAQSGAGDQVVFSSALGSLARAMSTFHAQRASAVQALAAQYQNGTYRPDSLATSRSMVAHALATGDE